jgi:hypothetical protein
VKFALTVSAALIKTLQPPVPEQAPPQPVKPLPVPAVSVSVTDELSGKVAEQVPGQLIPAGLLVTVPVPAILVVKVAVVAVEVKVAFTVSLEETFTLHVLVPEQPPPLQPAKA